MTERELFYNNIPEITAICLKCRELSKEQYEEWKRETLEETPDEVKEYISKVLAVIDLQLEKFQKGAAHE